MAGRMPLAGPGRVGQQDRTAFAERVLEVLSQTGDVASEATWQAFAQVIGEYWLVFQGDQSPLSTWGMIAKCTETVLKIRAFARLQKGESGQDALAGFRQMMGEVLGDEAT